MKRVALLLALLAAGIYSGGSSGGALAETVERQTDFRLVDNIIRSGSRSTHALTRTSAERLRKRSRGQRFVEFRGEMAYFPGNTVLRHGFLGPDGEPDEYEAVAFQADHGVFGLVLGSIVPVRAKVGVYPWDDVVTPGRRYLVKINKRRHQRLMAYIEETRRSKKTFYLYTDNCVRFARGAARVIGLTAPEQTFVLPPIYVNALKFANGG